MILLYDEHYGDMGNLGRGFVLGGLGDVVAFLFPSLPSFLSFPTTPPDPCPQLPVSRQYAAPHGACHIGPG